MDNDFSKTREYTETRRWSVFQSRRDPRMWIARLDSNLSLIHPILHRAFRSWGEAMDYVDVRVNNSL